MNDCKDILETAAEINELVARVISMGKKGEERLLETPDHVYDADRPKDRFNELWDGIYYHLQFANEGIKDRTELSYELLELVDERKSLT